MKDFPTNDPTSAPAEVATPDTSDQEKVALNHFDAKPCEYEVSSSIQLTDIGISLPSASRAERKVAVKSKGHFCGHLVVGADHEQVIAIESHLEMNCALILSARPEVIELREQVGFSWIDENGCSRIHYFDLIATLRDGTTIAVFVKPFKASRGEKFVSEARQIVPQLTSAFADKVVLMTERHINPIELYNAELLHSVRLPDPDLDLKATAVVQELQGSATVADLANKISVPGQGIRAVVRMVRNNVLELVQHERITASSLIRRRAA